MSAMDPLPASPRKPHPRWLLAAFIVITSVVAILIGSAEGQIFTQSDVGAYLAIARRQPDVLQPFASRQLGPLVARALSHLAHGSIQAGFVIEGVLSLVVLAAIIGLLLIDAAVPTLLLTAVGGLAFWAGLFNGLALPDLWDAALIGLFLLMLRRNRFLVAALLLFPLYVSRESTILVLVVLLAVAWKQLGISGRLLALAASAGGILLVKSLNQHAHVNREHIGPLLYLIGKVPWNFMKNVLGLPMWTPLNAGNCASPAFRFTLRYGPIHNLGVCQYQPQITLWTITLGLTSFGLLPLIFIFLASKRRNLLWPGDIMLRFCVVYGLVSFLIAPELGSSVPRLFAYAWPLFVVAVPIYLAKELSLPRGRLLALVAIHLAVAWIPMAYGYQAISIGYAAITLLLIMIGYFAGWRLLSSSAARLKLQAA